MKTNSTKAGGAAKKAETRRAAERFVKALEQAKTVEAVEPTSLAGDETLMEAVPFDEFIRRYGPKTPEEAEQTRERLKKEPPFADGEYEEPEPPARTIEELDAQWKANGMPDDLRARAIAEVKRLDLLGPSPEQLRAAAATRFLAEDFAIRGQSESETVARLGELLRGKKIKLPNLEAIVRAAYAAHQGVVDQQTVVEQQNKPWVLAKDVQSEKVEWLWYGRLARGKYAVLDGDPGQGKSGITIDLAARISTGVPMPEEARRREPRGVVLISYEDGAADTIRPRLEAAGADLNRIAIFDLSQTPTLDKEGLAKIEAAIRAVNAVLVVIDPLVASIDDKKDSNNDHQMRRSLKHLVALCEKRRVAVLGVRHRVKGQHKNAVTSGGGSIGIIGAARMGMMVAGDPDAPEDRHTHLLAVSKCNLAPMQPTLKYKTGSATVNDPSGRPIETMKIEWTGTSQFSGDAIVAREAARADRRDVVREVTEALRQMLKDGPLPAAEVCEKLGREKDDWALKKAKERLQVRAEKEKGKGKGRATHWVWVLPAPTLEEETT